MAPITQSLNYRIELLIVDGIPLSSIIQFFTKIDNMVLFLTQHSTYSNAQDVTSDLENFQKIWKTHNRSFRHPLLEFPERLDYNVSPFEFPLFQIVSNWGHDTKILDKLSVELANRWKLLTSLMLQGSGHSIITLILSGSAETLWRQQLPGRWLSL